jgi:hypothetical protein
MNKLLFYSKTTGNHCLDFLLNCFTVFWMFTSVGLALIVVCAIWWTVILAITVAFGFKLPEKENHQPKNFIQDAIDDGKYGSATNAQNKTSLFRQKRPGLDSHGTCKNWQSVVGRHTESRFPTVKRSFWYSGCFYHIFDGHSRFFPERT